MLKSNSSLFRGSMVFIGLLLLAAGICAAAGPKIRFEETSWDFGPTPEGKVLSHVFFFHNDGDAALTIDRVRTTCGCTAALVSKKKIPSGEKGEIRIQFRTKGYSGFNKKYVFVDSDDPEQPRVTLWVTADIDIPPSPKIVLDRYNVDLGLKLNSEELYTRITIKNQGQKPLTVSCNHKTAVFYQGKKELADMVTIAPGRETEIDVRIPPRDYRGVLREYILLRTNDPRTRSLSVHINAYLVSELDLKLLFQKHKDLIGERP